MTGIGNPFAVSTHYAQALSADEAAVRLTSPLTTTSTEFWEGSGPLALVLDGTLDEVVRPPHEVVWVDVKIMAAHAYAAKHGLRRVGLMEATARTVRIGPFLGQPLAYFYFD